MSEPPRCVEALGDVVAWTRRHCAVATAVQFSRAALDYRHLAGTERLDQNVILSGAKNLSFYPSLANV
ncbi:MAG TPA: hypothetical protein VFH87_16105 [Candidatus Udaeobacter sp.]|jgi:hypothetical protein|nr:hypothetical protein [Candidatus Udaeobacter sp.]